MFFTFEIKAIEFNIKIRITPYLPDDNWMRLFIYLQIKGKMIEFKIKKKNNFIIYELTTEC